VRIVVKDEFDHLRDALVVGSGADGATATERPADVPDYQAWLRLDGRVHVVVGAGQGMGRQAAHALAAAGARVVCVDVDAGRAEAVARETGGRAAVADITEDGQIDGVLAAAERDLGPVSGVTNIVGMTRWVALSEATDEDWQWQNAIVSGQALRTLRAAVPFLARAGGGTLTYVASVSAFTSAPGHGLYGMAKAALLSLTRTAAVELGPQGIRVNTISPGATQTPRIAGDPRFAAAMRENAARTPLRKVAEPADIAAALLFVASPLAGHVTGQDLIVDGGLANTWPLALPD
jgi:NAD(P)-dependent dehydrogenase (short-subunit alcohol dehydrogenase family)